MLLGERAWRVGEKILARSSDLRVGHHTTADGTLILDCGVNALGGLAAGCQLAEACMSRLGRVRLVPGCGELAPGPAVAVATDEPVLACLASQYAGWPISYHRYFAMGSGPMRAARGREPLLVELALQEHPTCTVGVLETSELPNEDVCREIATSCGVSPESLMLLAARTASIAGSIQIVARSVETALHKLHELKFDVRRIRSAWGVAPLPPIAADDLQGIGRTNDAILYGAEVTLWVEGDDESIVDTGSKTPSNSSRDFGRPFGELFHEYDYDFYKIDPLLFSPARISFMNVSSGRVHTFGEQRPDVLAKSFGHSPSSAL